jgi:hypothetical protein
MRQSYFLFEVREFDAVFFDALRAARGAPFLAAGFAVRLAAAGRAGFAVTAGRRGSGVGARWTIVNRV